MGGFAMGAADRRDDRDRRVDKGRQALSCGRHAVVAGYRFSTGENVTATSFKDAFNRVADPKMASQMTPFIRLILPPS